MIQLQRLLFFISLLCSVVVANAQQEKGPGPKKEQKQDQEKDTTRVEQVYGIRFGVDISKPIIALIDNDYKGLEFVADVRVYKNIYAALEFGYDDKTTDEDYINFTSKGSYFKLGANYNAYDNWAGMTNEIYVGLRYGVSFFDQTVNSYTPNMYGTYFVADQVEPNISYDNQSIQWVEFVMGIKAETLKNLYMGFSLSFKLLTSGNDPDNFKNMYAPGFNRISLNNMGFGYNYTLSYLIPYAKK